MCKENENNSSVKENLKKAIKSLAYFECGRCFTVQDLFTTKDWSDISPSTRAQLGITFFNWVRDVCMDKKYAVPLIVPIGKLGMNKNIERMQYQVLWFESHRSFEQNSENADVKKVCWDDMAQDAYEHISAYQKPGLQ